MIYFKNNNKIDIIFVSSDKLKLKALMDFFYKKMLYKYIFFIGGCLVFLKLFVFELQYLGQRGFSQIFSLLRSPHVNKTAREQFSYRGYFGICRFSFDSICFFNYYLYKKIEVYICYFLKNFFFKEKINIYHSKVKTFKYYKF